jgi:hypothetical protein
MSGQVYIPPNIISMHKEKPANEAGGGYAERRAHGPEAEVIAANECVDSSPSTRSQCKTVRGNGLWSFYISGPAVEQAFGLPRSAGAH